MNNMGGGGSKPAGPKIIEEPKPSVRSSIDGLEVSKAQGCRSPCSFRVTPGISVSSVTVTRKYGFVEFDKCTSYSRFKQDVIDGKLSYIDFKRKLQGGELYQFSGNPDSGFCRQVKLPQEVADKTNNINDLNGVENQLITVRVQPASSGGDFSASTKMDITPSIPPSIEFNGRQVQINKMTFYYPSPLRIEGVQHDAVFSLNDPSDPSARTIVLIPVKASASPGPDALFFGRLAAYTPAISQENPVTGEIASVNVPTGTTWSLSTILPVNEKGEVKGGFFSWTGVATYERFLSTNTSAVKKYSFKAVPGPNYIMLKEPAAMNAIDFTSLQSIPPTPPREAIHAVPDTSRSRYMYKAGIPKNCGKKRERFTLEGGDEDSCNMFSSFENMPPKGPTLASLVSWVLSFVTLLAMTLGVYVGLRTVLNPDKGNIIPNWAVRTRNWLLKTTTEEAPQ